MVRTSDKRIMRDPHQRATRLCVKSFDHGSQRGGGSGGLCDSELLAGDFR